MRYILPLLALTLLTSSCAAQAEETDCIDLKKPMYQQIDFDCMQRDYENFQKNPTEWAKTHHWHKSHKDPVVKAIEDLKDTIELQQIQQENHVTTCTVSLGVITCN